MQIYGKNVCAWWLFYTVWGVQGTLYIELVLENKLSGYMEMDAGLSLIVPICCPVHVRHLPCTRKTTLSLNTATVV